MLSGGSDPRERRGRSLRRLAKLVRPTRRNFGASNRTKIYSGWSFAPEPMGELTAPPDYLAGGEGAGCTPPQEPSPHFGQFNPQSRFCYAVIVNNGMKAPLLQLTAMQGTDREENGRDLRQVITEALLPLLPVATCNE